MNKERKLAEHTRGVLRQRIMREDEHSVYSGEHDQRIAFGTWRLMVST